jgi:hypothetical protein
MNPKAPHDVLKAISRTVDVLLRVAAIIAALASLPMALFLAAMANGNSKSATITIIMLLVYLALIFFLIWFAARAKRAWSRGIIYIIGVAGIWGGVDPTSANGWRQRSDSSMSICRRHRALSSTQLSRDFHPTTGSQIRMALAWKDCCGSTFGVALTRTSP